MISAEELSDIFVEVAGTLVSDFDLVDFLCNLCERAAAICETEAVGILLADERGRLRFVAGSDERVGMVELFEIQTAEGPCFDAFQEHRQISHPDLREAAVQWPKFAPRAVEAGFGSVHSIPLRWKSEAIGALNVFATSTGRFDTARIRIVQALADVATISILHERNLGQAETLTGQLQHALFGRVIIEQAKGALGGMRGVEPDQAFALMRTFARESGQRLRVVAQTVIDDPGSIPALTKAP